MNVIGLIAEYNPFHNGHLYQINKIKKIYPDSILIVILNGNFTQRADTSLINKWDKTKILLENNVDLVISLPTFYGINNADIFASGALEILNDLKIDTLIFGSELDDTNLLIDIVKAKINNSKYKIKIKSDECNYCHAHMGNKDLLAAHKENDCPMFIKCPKCSINIEVKRLNPHLLYECAMKSNYKLCKRCFSCSRKEQMNVIYFC